MPHQVLSWLKEPLEVQWALDVPNEWFARGVGLRLYPPELRVQLRAAPDAKKLAKLNAAQVGAGEWIVRRETFEPLMRESLRDATVVDPKSNVVTREFALLDPREWWPLDRSVSKVKWTNGFLDRLSVPAWKTAPAPLFRIGEALSEIVASEELGEGVRAASGGLLGHRAVTESELSQRAVHTFHPKGHAAREADEIAETAFWELVAGNVKARAKAVSCGEWAWWVARSFDRKLKPDALKGVTKDALAAALAAMHFGDDRAVLSKACERDWLAALSFGRFVRGDVPREFEAVLRAAGEDVDAEREVAAAMFAATR